MRCCLVDSLEWVYPDSKIGGKSRASLDVDVARGGTAACVILMNGIGAGAGIRVAARSAFGTGVKFYRLADVPVEQNTGPVGFVEREGERNQFVTRRAPFRVYDAMQPILSSFKANSPTEAVLVQIPVPNDARPGKRDCVISIEHGGEESVLRLGMMVHRPIVPPVGRDSFLYTNWFSLDNMATRHGLRAWSEGHWDMIRRYARLMARGRQNTFLFSLKDVFRGSGADLCLDRRRLRRLVKTFIGAGMYYIEGGHFGGRSTAEWTCPTFAVGLTKHLAGSAEGNADIARIARQLMGEIEANKWRDRYFQHVADEPIAANAADYRVFVGTVRKYMPGIPILDATMCLAMSGSVDIWCPQAQSYQKDRAGFDALRETGDRIWFYTCCLPGGPWLNRLLDMELLRPALFGWGAALFGLDGYLHWGLNQYRKNQDPFKMNVIPNWGGGSNSLPAGDTHVVYPGDDGPWSSLRFEAQREGFEDLELLRMLALRKPGLASAVIRPVIRAFDKYTKSVDVFRAARRRLLERLAKNGK